MQITGKRDLKTGRSLGEGREIKKIEIKRASLGVVRTVGKGLWGLERKRKV